MNKLPIIVLDFSGVYDFEAFASIRNIIRVDCKDLKGVDCYCDEEGREQLHRRLAPYPSKAILSWTQEISIILPNTGCHGCRNLSL